MQISDDLMYRYYELLTDVQMHDLARLRADITAGNQDPMDVKMALALRVVADFHSPAEADSAFEAFTREVREHLEPADTETVDLPPAATSEKGIRLDKLIALIGLSPSVTEATRRIKAGAVEINGVIHKELLLNIAAGLLVIRVGKQWRRVRLNPGALVQ